MRDDCRDDRRETTAETTTVDVGGGAELEAAADEYEEYVVEQTALLADLTEGFTDAVIAGDVDRAKELYAPARVPWERIEPIAAQLGDYDPNIDARGRRARGRVARVPQDREGPLGREHHGGGRKSTPGCCSRT